MSFPSFLQNLINFVLNFLFSCYQNRQLLDVKGSQSHGFSDLFKFFIVLLPFAGLQRCRRRIKVLFNAAQLGSHFPLQLHYLLSQCLVYCQIYLFFHRRLGFLCLFDLNRNNHLVSLIRFSFDLDCVTHCCKKY